MLKLGLFFGFLRTSFTRSQGVRFSGLLESIRATISIGLTDARLFLLSICLSVVTFTSQAQEHVFDWAVSMNLNTTRADVALFSTAVDATGNVYTVGQFEGTDVDFDPTSGTYLLSSKGSQDVFVQKLDAAGNFLWAKSYGSTLATAADVAYGIAVDAAGNTFVTGRFAGTIQFNPGATDPAELTTTGSADAFVLKLDTDGNFLWVKKLGGTSFDAGNDITIDAVGNVYTTGTFQGTADFDPGSGVFNLVSAGGSDIFVQKMDADGNFVWAKSMGGTGTDTGYSLAVDDSENVYVTGSFIESGDFDPGPGVFTLNAGAARNIFVSKLNADGSFGWAKSFGTPTVHNDGYGITADASGNVYITGAFRGTNVAFGGYSLTSVTSSSNDAVILKMDTDGNVVWAKNVGGAGADSGYSIAVDNFGNVYTTGFFAAGTNIDFDPNEEGVFSLPNVGGNDIFVHMLDKEGDLIWAKAMGAGGSDAGNSIAVDGGGNVYTSGRFTETVDFDPGLGTFPLTVSGGGTYGAFIQKLKPVIRLTANWDNGTSVVSVEEGDELELTFGEQGTLTLSHNNSDTPSFVFLQDPTTNALLGISGSATGNVFTLTGVRACAEGEEGTLNVRLPATANFDAIELNFRVKINKKPITVGTDELSKGFGETDPVFSFTLLEGSIVSGQTVSGALSRTAGEAIGSYDFNLGTLAIMSGSSNVTSSYDISIDPPQFQIRGSVLTIAVTNGLNKSYGAADPVFTYGLSEGVLPQGYRLSGDMSRVPGENVGSYPFLANEIVVLDSDNNDVSSNYTILLDPSITFTVIPVQIAVAAVPLVKVYGEDDPELVYTVVGLVNNEQASEIFMGSLQRVAGENAGAYAINRHTLTLIGSNYSWNPNSFIGADLTIHRAPQVIDFTTYEEVQLNAGIMPLTALSTSGLPVTLSVDAPSVAMLSGTDLNLLREGIVVVTATQEGDSNYEAADPVVWTIRIIAANYNNLVRVSQNVSPNGDGIHDFLIIDGIENYPDSKITIFDKGGKVITEISGYDNNQKVFTGATVRDGTYFYRLNIVVSGANQYYQGFFEVKRN